MILMTQGLDTTPELHLSLRLWDNAVDVSKFCQMTLRGGWPMLPSYVDAVYRAYGSGTFGLFNAADSIVGSGWILIHNKKHVATIGAISVDADYRRRGWAEKTMATLLDVALTGEVESVDLICANPSALALYQSFGFKSLRNTKCFTLNVNEHTDLAASGLMNPHHSPSTTHATEADWEEIVQIADNTPGVDDGRCLRLIYNAAHDTAPVTLVTHGANGLVASFGCLIPYKGYFIIGPVWASSVEVAKCLIKN